MYRKAIFLVAIFMMVGLSACTFQVNTTVEEDGSGDWRTEIGFDATDQATLTEFGMAADEFCEELNSEMVGDDVPAGTSVVTETRGEELFCVIAVPFTNLDELRTLYDGDGITINTLSLTEEQFLYDVTVDTSDDALDTDDFGDFNYTASWVVTVPGRVVSHNATEIDGNTLTWDLSSGGTVNMQVESDLSSGSTTTIIIAVVLSCLCLLILVAAGAGAFFFVRQRGK